MDNDNKIVKYKGYVRKSAINILAWLENNPNPTQEKAHELWELRGKIKDAIFNYKNNIKDWEKHTAILPTKVIEQQEWLDEVQGTHGDKIADGN